MKEERLQKIYDYIANNGELRAENLIAFGFNSNDLTSLVEDKVLKSEENGIYTFIDIDGLYFYSKSFIINKDYEKAKILLKRCLEIDPNFYRSAFHLFFQAIKVNDFELAFQYFDKIYQSDNIFYRQDCNLYLYLLNFICQIPEKYKLLVDGTTLSDIKVLPGDKRFQNIDYENEIREAIYNLQFPKAEKMIYTKSELKTVNYLVASLIIIAKKKLRKDKQITLSQIKKMIINRNYEDLVRYFEGKKENLTSKEKLFSSLCQTILNMKSTFTIPSIKDDYSLDVFTAIKNEDYEQALRLSIVYNKENGIVNENSILYLLLKDINGLIRKIKNRKMFTLEKKSKNDRFSINTIYNLLINGNIKKALKVLHVFLEINNLTNYEIFITSLIKLSLKEQDFTFMRPIQNLVYLTNGYNFEVKRYKEYFYEALSDNDLESANLYLRIILNLKEMQNIAIDTSTLKEDYNIVLNRKK